MKTRMTRIFENHIFATAALLAAICVLALPLGAAAQTAHYDSAQQTFGSLYKPFAIAVGGPYGWVYTAGPTGENVYHSAPGAMYSGLAIGETSYTPNGGLAVDSKGNMFLSTQEWGPIEYLNDCTSGVCFNPLPVVSSYSFAVDGNDNVFAGGSGLDGSSAVYEMLASEGYSTSYLFAGLGGSALNGTLWMGAGDVSANKSDNILFVAANQDGYAGLFLANSGGTYPYPSPLSGASFTSTALDNSGNAYATIIGATNAYKLDNGGSGWYHMAGCQVSPNGIAVDGKGNVYMIGNSPGFVTNFTSICEILAPGWTFPSTGNTPAIIGFYMPITLTFVFDSDGTLGGVKALTEGVENMDFTVGDKSSCVAGNFYSAGQSCTVDTFFTPKFDGQRNGAIVLTDSTGAAIATKYIQATGTGKGPQITFLPGTQSTLGSGFTGLNAPQGVAVDGKGNVFVADTANNAVKEIAASGAITTLGSGFSAPTGVAIDGAGNIVVADTGNSEVKQIVKQGGYTTVNTLGSGFSSPQGVAVDGKGDVFVADTGNNEVKRIAAGNGAIKTLGSGYSSPQGVAVDGADDIFIADTGNKEVEEIVAGGNTPTPIGSGFSAPQGVAVDGVGDVFVTDSGKVTQIPPSGGFTTLNPIVTSGLTSPQGVAVDALGNVFVTDSTVNSVYKYDLVDPPNVVFTGIMGTSTTQTVTIGNADNTPIVIAAYETQFQSPSYIYPPETYFTQVASGGADCSSTTTLSTTGQQCEIALEWTARPPAGTQSGDILLGFDSSGGTSNDTLNISGSGLYAQAISFSFPASATYSAGLSYALSNYASSQSAFGVNQGTPIAFSITTGSGIANISNGNTLNITGAGTVTITASEPAGGYFAAATPVTQSITINPIMPTVSVTPASLSITNQQSLNVTVAVSGGAGNPTPTGSVILSGGGYNPTFTQTPLSSSGSVTINIPAGTLKGGSWIFTASYAPDAASTSFYGAASGSSPLPVTVIAPAAMISPAPSSTLSDSSETFTWSAVAGATEYALSVGDLSVGSSNLYKSAALRGTTSATVTGLPVNGENLYVSLCSFISGAWQCNNYTYSMSGAPVLAVLTSPEPGTQLGGSSATFQWTPGSGITNYLLMLGTTGKGSHDIYDGVSTTNTSVNLTTLPTNGVTVYARLYSQFNGSWAQYVDSTYTEYGTPVPAALLTPAPDSMLTSSSVTFTWSPGSGVTEYTLAVGDLFKGSNNLYQSGGLRNITSATVTGLPVNGENLYVRLCSYSGNWQCADYTYTITGTPVLAALTSPVPGSTLTGSSATFQWAPGAGITSYILDLGTKGAGSHDLYTGVSTTATLNTVTGLPTNGVTIYARLYSHFNGSWAQYIDYTYTAQ